MEVAMIHTPGPQTIIPQSEGAVPVRREHVLAKHPRIRRDSTIRAEDGRVIEEQ